MELEEKLKELNMTEEEIGRFSTAFKDEKFREMLREYAEEISNPDNKKRYEEEIRLLEQERGHNVEFIHPEPFRCLRTSVNGQDKCYINVCANEKVGKPSCKSGVSETGQRGHCWSLPHCLHPGRQDLDQNRKKIMIYDVIFHPDTIHMASKSKKFMEIVDGAAIQGIQDAFKVTLDKNNVKNMKVKYKGTPQAPVIRKPIPGYQAKEPKEEWPDPLAFPYADEKGPTTCKTTTKGSSATKPQSFQIQPEKTNKPTEPKYTVKYRSFFDLQDFRCSRDSGRSPRPKEIVVTIDLPLLKSVGDTSLEIKERNLLLESKNPMYRLELALAYPVDEDKGEAKFNKHSRQLTVTLPVLPSKEVFDFPGAPPAGTVTEIQRGDEDGQEEEKGRCEKQIGEGEEKVEGEQEERRRQKVEGEEGEEKGQGERRGEGEEEEEEKRGGEKCAEEKKEVGDGWKEPKAEDEEEGKGPESVEGGKEEGEEEEIKQQKMEKGQREGEEGTVEEERREDKTCEEKREVEDRWKEVKMEKRNVREEERAKEEMKQQKMEVEGGEDGKDKGGEEKEQDEEEKREGKKCEEEKEVEDTWKEVKMEEEMKLQEMEGSEDGKDRGDEERGQEEEEEEERGEEKEGEEKKEGEEYEEEKREVGGKWKEPKKDEEEEEEEEEEEGRSEQQVEDRLKNTGEEEDENVESTTQMTTSDVYKETEKADTEKVKGQTSHSASQTGTDASFPHRSPSTNPPSSHQTHAGGSGCSGLSPEEAVVDEDRSAQREDIDEDDLTTEQVFHNLIHDDRPPPVLLREISEDGSEKILSDHSTSAGFTFQNSLLFELD